MRLLSHFAAGVIFALGLAISGMTRPDKVIGFLDFTGAWDPSLMFVMAGAIAVNVALFYPTIRRARPVFAPKFGIPSRSDIDLRLVGGAALFGAGWGLGGYCPGPGLASASTLAPKGLTFVVAMIAGMSLFKFAQQASMGRAARKAQGAVQRLGA
ncbi:MAG: YeeE/YedE family protein [Myxococcales bacterium]|nr:YeeE/YedE family protein [Myxococcales bacterium]